MRLNPEETRIALEENVILIPGYADDRVREDSSSWTATLTGVSLNEGAEIEMSRGGSNPGEALRNLFEAMHAMDVTL